VRFSSASTISGAILANYSFGDDSPLPGVSLPIRFEYIGSTGNAASGAYPPAHMHPRAWAKVAFGA
jgi:hypothetical protein